MTEPTPTPPSWLRETLGMLRLRWRPLLAIMVLTELAYVAAVNVLPVVLYHEDGPLSSLNESAAIVLLYGLPAVLAGLSSAWTWAAAVEVLRGADEGHRVRIGAALHRGLLRSGRLALWLVGVNLLRAAGAVYLFHTMLEGLATPVYRTARLAVVGGGWYLSFAVALLPLVVLLERRGAGRAWWLAHSRVATFGQIVAVLAFGLAADNLAALTLDGIFPRVPGELASIGPKALLGTVADTVTLMVTTAALATAYLRRATPATVDASAGGASMPEAGPAGGPAAGGSPPVVIELGRTW